MRLAWTELSHTATRKLYSASKPVSHAKKGRWSPLHELVPETPLRHGHAISIDMAYSATLANNRKLITDDEHRRILSLFSRAGLSMDHPQFNEEILEKGTAAILKTRDGKLRAAVPNPIGTCTFINDASADELNSALRRHKELMKGYPRNGEGLEAFVDASDTGYTDNSRTEVEALEVAATKAGDLNGNGHIHGGHIPIDNDNGINGHANLVVNGVKKTVKEGLVNGDSEVHANGVNGHSGGHANGVNGHSEGHANGVNGNSEGHINGVNGHTNGVKA